MRVEGVASRHPGVYLARISIFETVASGELQLVRAKPDKLYKSLQTRSSRAENGGPLTGNVVLSSVQRIFRARSRAGASRDDCLFLLHVAGNVLARISFFETVASDKLQVVRAKPDKLYKSLEMLFSVDGGPLTDNVVLNSDQRVHRF